MDQESIQPILDELFSGLEPLDAQSSALLQFLKAKGLATDKEFAPFLEKAANAASVRWLAVRVRSAALIANLMRPEEESAHAPAGTSETSAGEKDKEKPHLPSPQESTGKTENTKIEVESSRNDHAEDAA